MSFPLPSRTPSGPRRRTLFAAAAGAFALAGCSAPEPSGDTTGGSRPSAADRARARAARDSMALSDRYTAVIAAHPQLAERLAPLRAEVVRHAKAFGGGGAGASASPAGSASPSASAPASSAGSPSASPSSSASESAPASASGSGSASASASAGASPGVAARPKDALADLASAELALADERTQTLVDVPGELARLLASVAASGAAHAFLLTKAAK
ncbi:hypothetical protein CW362_27290 [Streptomyces populi]|uniref:Lipoprotein n=1 Tax=Streptomyces populi TaxID=2058924 RepID=A0A2I0SIW0_9ACTN|nr:hypothetical protein [Streptomyces populi]PKT69876.1 hypothetical protein CW362_27290 [Streptomyces populi]